MMIIQFIWFCVLLVTGKNLKETSTLLYTSTFCLSDHTSSMIRYTAIYSTAIYNTVQNAVPHCNLLFPVEIKSQECILACLMSC